jgi:nucleoside-diphosphate-sugar epimerase
VLVVGGTGPTGYALVERLLAAGERVTILHTGAHEIEFSDPVEHLHCDPTSRDDLRATLGARTFDAAISTSGRLNRVVEVLNGRVRSLAAITGLPAYVGWQVPPGQAGYPVPLREDDPPIREIGQADGDGLTARVLENERAVLDAAGRGAFRATVLRYTMVYGPYSYIPFEWFFVRRVLDGRRRVALEADGLMLPQRGYAENLAAAVVLALDHPQASGRVFNVGDEQVLSVRAIAETIAGALDHEFEFVSVPLTASPCANPFALRQNTMFDLGAIKGLGYADAVRVVEGTRRAARWLAEHPVGRGSSEEASLGARAFDYQAEDRAIDIYRRALQSFAEPLSAGAAT